MRTSIALAALAAGMTFAVIPASAQKVYKLKAGFVTINDSNHFVADFLKKELAKTTNGRIDVQVFPAAQLGRIPRQLEGLQLGTQEAFLVPPGFFVGIDQSFQVPDAPGRVRRYQPSVPHDEPSAVPREVPQPAAEGWLRRQGHLVLRRYLDRHDQALQEAQRPEGPENPSARLQDGKRTGRHARRHRGAHALQRSPARHAARHHRWRPKRHHRHVSLQVLYRRETRHADRRRPHSLRRMDEQCLPPEAARRPQAGDRRCVREGHAARRPVGRRDDPTGGEGLGQGRHGPSSVGRRSGGNAPPRLPAGRQDARRQPQDQGHVRADERGDRRNAAEKNKPRTRYRRHPGQAGRGCFRLGSPADQADDFGSESVGRRTRIGPTGRQFDTWRR